MIGCFIYKRCFLNKNLWFPLIYLNLRILTFQFITIYSYKKLIFKVLPFLRGIVYIVWNIDSIIYKIKNTKNIPIYSIPIKTIINDKEILYEDFDSILSDINQDLKIGFPHKLDSIIIGELPNLCQKTVIDGNHRLLEAYIAGSKNISCYYILPQDAIQFLQKDSQLFILLADQLFKAIL